MDESKFRIYPRGFLGAAIDPQVVRTPKQSGSVLDQLQYRKENVTVKNTANIIANPHVDSIYASYIKNDEQLNTFEFRKKLLQAALSAFGTPCFKTWYLLQHQSPTAGDMHNRFLVDTLKYITNGRREAPVQTWAVLLRITDEGNSIGPVHDYAKDFFDLNAGGLAHQQTGDRYLLPSIIQRWCAQPTGTFDLLDSLHILFGNAD